MFEREKSQNYNDPELPPLERWDQNFNVSNTGPRFKSLEGQYKNSILWKHKITIPMLIEIGPEFQCFD